ncbi:sodium/calcium exchanger [Fulvivirga imtechensis AK7]|uniref:Sodium/calcium exchanger n=1 Tax=Fulvivirga imtechensis AK7 TaxID=1237149 RepID=L8JRX3_9BACT|nr:calcium/sodium antiporter [Fulvivirga imtechensis]ELR70953.1 sodium/calcium exchanger [Fulvivirga imtechensis AK7]
MLLNILMLVVGLFVLIIGGDFLVKGASSIALRAHISPLVVGLTIVAFGTSAPELLISIKAALDGSPDMTMGNVVGSNICNLTLILGVTALLGSIRVQADSIKIDWPVTMGSSLLLYFMVKEETAMIKTYEGITFLALLIVYTVFIIRKSRKETKARRALEEELELEDTSKNIVKDIVYIILGGAGLYFGADWFVGGAKDLALFLGVSERVIGITVLALGTSLPELVTSVVASVKKETDLALGNLMGSNIFNILSILGITSIIKDIHVSEQIIRYDMLTMIGVTLLILPMMLYRRMIGRVAGAILLLVYIVYTYTVIV